MASRWIRSRLNSLLAIVALLLTMAAAHAVASEITVITFPSNQIDGQWMAEVVKRYEAKYPDRKVELVVPGNLTDKILSMVAAGTPPEIAYHDVQVARQWAADGLLYDLESWISSTPLFNDVFPFMWQLATHDGRRFAVPLNVAATEVNYNRALFREAGLPYPSPDWTYGDMLDFARRIAKDTSGDGENDVWGVAPPDGVLWQHVIWSFGGDLADSDYNPQVLTLASDPATLEAATYLHSLVHVHQVASPPWWRPQDPYAQMRQGILGMLMTNSGGFGILPSNRDELDWEVAPVPAGAAGQIPYVFTFDYFVFKDAPNVEGALHFLEYLFSDESMELLVQYTGKMPARSSIANTAFMEHYAHLEGLPQFFASLVNGRGPVHLPTQAWEIVINAYMDIMNNRGDVRSILEAAQDRANPLSKFRQ